MFCVGRNVSHPHPLQQWRIFELSSLHSQWSNDINRMYASGLQGFGVVLLYPGCGLPDRFLDGHHELRLQYNESGLLSHVSSADLDRCMRNAKRQHRGFPTPTYVAGQGVYDCYTLSSITAGQRFSVVAHGIITASASNLDGWYSESLISTTTWATPTTAYIFHPGVNILLGSSGSGSGSGSGNGTSSTTASNAIFSLFSLGLAASIGILVAIAIGGICCLGCFAYCVRRLIVGRRKPAAAVSQPMQATTTVPYAPPQGYTPQPQYSYGAPQPYGAAQPYGSPPPQYGAPQYGAYKAPETHVSPA
jgi:hypothetical protein